MSTPIDEPQLVTGADLIAEGWVAGPAFGIALAIARELSHSGATRLEAMAALTAFAANPDPAASGDWQRLGRALADQRRRTEGPVPPPDLGAPRPYPIWGAGLIDINAIAQMDVAMSLPVSTRGALMPDAHVGYGLPIGGVLETKDVVIPYAVGSDIACRMRLTILDVDAGTLDRDHDQLTRALVEGTVFGAGKQSAKPADASVLHADWSGTPLLKTLRELAGKQLGTSGSGNHFVEWGSVSWDGRDLLAIMSHSGSRGVGFKIADHYSRLAEQRRVSDLPKEAIRLAWLELDSDEGQEYWQSMELAGRFASDNHAIIHGRILEQAGLMDDQVTVVENHHNFAWAESVEDGSTLVVHRKGATPAGEGVMGVIPGSMGANGFVVSGKGNPGSLSSASHGAGRAMGRRDAQRRLTQAMRDEALRIAGVTLIGGGLDEAPQAYKSIEHVMAAQADLVDTVAVFTPRIVRMDTGSRDI